MPELPRAQKIADAPSAGGGGKSSPGEEPEHSRIGNIGTFYRTKKYIAFLKT